MKIVVFDSGFGSLSVIKEIQKKVKSDIIYFADQKNFPYGKKSKKQLLEIINQSLDMISRKFNPDLIVLASNTPSLLLRDKLPKGIINVLPPLGKISTSKKSHNIAKRPFSDGRVHHVVNNDYRDNSKIDRLIKNIIKA